MCEDNPEVPDVSPIVESVLKLLEESGVPTDVNDQVTSAIEQWEAKQAMIRDILGYYSAIEWDEDRHEHVLAAGRSYFDAGDLIFLGNELDRLNKLKYGGGRESQRVEEH